MVGDDEGALQSNDSCYSVTHTVAHVKINKQPRVDLELSEVKSEPGKHIACVLDTGTSFNIMSISDLHTLVPNAVLRKSESRLHLYDGLQMKPLGVYTIYARYGDKSQRLRFEIVKTHVARRPLLSSNTCQRLGLITIHNSGVSYANSRSASAVNINKANDNSKCQGSKSATSSHSPDEIMD